MARKPLPPRTDTPPTREEILAFIKDAPGRVSRRELVRAFGLSSDARPLLRQVLGELEQSGAVERGHGRRVGTPGSLPEVTTLVISGTDSDGELLARPLAWTGGGSPPRIFMVAPRGKEPPLGIGDRVLARLKRARGDIYEARTIRRLTEGPATVLGVYEKTGDGGGRLKPVDRRQRAEFRITASDANGAESGELVMAEILPGIRPYGPRLVRVMERIGSMDAPHALSLVAIHAHGIPNIFPEDAKAQAAAAGAAPMSGRDDLRSVPLITIDGEDARDFDDAVWAEPVEGGGWHLAVAIADVAWYVRPGDALDREAMKRGNSVYFPDRVVPMLPEELSNGWCSLKPNEDRPCMVAEMWIDAAGTPIRHHFRRAMMRSAARLTYTQVQAAYDGQPDDLTAPLLEPVLKPLYGAWKALLAARERRGSLELDLPERQVIMGPDRGQIERVVPRARYDSHRLIEDFMIAANVAAATQIEERGLPCLYRIHDTPAEDKLVALHEVLAGMGLPSPRGQAIRPEHFNRLLAQIKDTVESHLVSELILRSQAQAAYSPENIGHFGLGLAKYAHFTSPIRRYADLMVHRALIEGLRLGAGGLDKETNFDELGKHLSVTERRAAAAEREALDRFTARFLADRIGATFPGRISGVARFGLFVTLNETGADGLLPASALPPDRWQHDPRHHALAGRSHTFHLGDEIQVILAEAAPLTGGLVFRLAEMPRGTGRTIPGPKGPRPKAATSRGPKGKGKPKAPRRR